ncbi:MAG TPA: hypothetical protein VGZ26_02000 [Pirellulales bacterium]|nr:hypothetical protein [Pirellulales bacterium]
MPNLGLCSDGKPGSPWFSCSSLRALSAMLCAIAVSVAARSSRADDLAPSGQPIGCGAVNDSSAPWDGGVTTAKFVDNVSARQSWAQQPLGTVVQSAQFQRRVTPPRPVPQTPPQTGPQTAPQGTPQTTPQTAPRPAGASDFALEGATRSLGGAGAPTSSTPYMIGDFFTSAGQLFVSEASPPNQAAKGQLVGTIPNAGGTRRVKISENNSPIPRDRVFFAFNEFNNAAAVIQTNQLTALDIQRYTPGFEKTFWGGQGSIELRSPVAYTQNSHVFVNGNGPPKQTQFGNMSLALKFLLWREDNFALAAGTGLNLPTAPDVQIFQFNQQALTLKNQSVHLLPYVGMYWAPTSRAYVQSFLQIDVDTNGNAVTVPNVGTVGRLNEQTFLYADVAMGYWLYRNPEARHLTGIIPILEFHYNTTLQNADSVVAQSGFSSFTLGNSFNRLDITNVTTGTAFRLGPLSFLTFAAVFPLKIQQSDRQFDSEVIAQFNRLF